MDVVEFNRPLKPGKSRFRRHFRKRKTPRSWGGFADGQKSRTAWNYDMHGRLAQIDDNGKLVTYKYNSKNQLAEQVINGIPVYYTYTQFGQLEGKYMGSKERAIAFLKYTYDNDGMITARNVNGANQLYTYDLKGQLTSVTQDGKVVESYTYDNAGNILKKVVQGKTTEFVYDAANQLASMTENSGEAGNNAVRRTDFVYDAAGRMTQQIHGEAGTDALRRTEYAYGWMNKVMSISENGKVSATYDYHVDGQVAKRLGSNGKAQDFFWDGLALIRRGETNLTNEPYVTGGNPIIANGTTLFNDILGTTQGATDGKEFSQITRDSFGQTLDNSTDTNYDYFTGKPKVEGLGYAFLFRNYAAGLGKWTTSDPLGYPDGWNNFAYVNNKVTNAIDWLGGYEIEWEGTWTTTEKNQVTSAFSSIKNRMEELVTQIENQANKIDSSISGAAELLANLATLKSGLQETIANINSTGYNLEIYKSDLGPEVMATYWVSSVFWYDDELTLNNTWFSNGDIQTVFHEVTHTWSDDGESNNDYMNAHLLESLFTNDLVNWPRYSLDYRSIFGARPE